MNRYILILVISFIPIFYCTSQERNWGGIIIGEASFGVPTNRWINHIALLNIFGSPYKSSPYAKFGLGTALIEGYPAEDRSTERGSYLPIQLHYVPYLRIIKWSCQPVSRVEETSDWIKYYYDPNLSKNKLFVKTMVDVYLSGSLWASNIDDGPQKNKRPFFGNRWYLRVGARLFYLIKLFEKPMLFMHFIPLGIDVGITVNSSLYDAKKYSYYPSAGLTISVGPLFVEE